MTRHAKLVSVRILEIRAVVVLVVLRPQTRRTLRGTAVCKRYSIGSVDDGSALRKKSDHLSVSGIVRCAVVGRPDEKERSRTRIRLPARPGTLALAEASRDPKRRHQWIVEAQCAIEVANADEDV